MSLTILRPEGRANAGPLAGSHRIHSMLTPINNVAKPDFFGLSVRELDDLLTGWGWPRFRAAQVREWAYQRFVADPEKMTNLSKADRAALEEAMTARASCC